ncbi:hypothetical protein TD95_002687 [Thielaviopsis punctulata]|uniref:DNA polymerase V n=1 Tax=Thielaviopsis punctulata TaxID=72032 RepID=A0A0F4ZFQ4_9PEZI|nr:hypothetical protein TD95_002687 [Thielaviopsis punctulata]
MGSKRKRGNNANKDGQKSQPKKAKQSSDLDPSTVIADIDADVDAEPAAAVEADAETTTTTVLRPFPAKPVDLKQPTESLDISDRIGEALLYDRLGSEDGSVRSAAALAILKGLLGCDAGAETEKPGVSEAELERHLEKRLFAGLSSGRNASRLGLSLVLTEVLFQLFGAGQTAAQRYPQVTFDSMLARLAKLKETIGNVPGQQERDVYFGQLFGIECFVKAKILEGQPERWFSLLNLLLKLAERKVWLRPQCGWIVMQALPQLSRAATKATLERLAKEGLAKTPEAVGLWLQARKLFPDMEVKPWGNPLSAKAMSDLAMVLKETVTDDGGEVHESRKTKVPNATSQVHFAWDLLGDHFYELGNEGAREFNSFWVRIVDDGLFSKTATNGQKLRGFLVFQKMLVTFSQHHDLIPVLFSRNLMACLMNQAAKDDRFLHIAAQRALRSVSDLAARFPATVTVLVRALLGNNGSYAFDARTNSKTVEKTLQKTPAVEAAAIVAFLEQRLRETTGPESADNVAHLHAYVEYLYKLMDSSELPENKAKTAEGKGSAASLAIQKLAMLSYAPAAEMQALGLTDKHKDLCKTRLESAFAKLSRRTEDMTYLCHAIAAIDPALFDMDAKIGAELAEARKQMTKLLQPAATAASQKDKASQSQLQQDDALRKGLALMYAISIFQLYNDDPDAFNMLHDLKHFQKQLKTLKKRSATDPAAALFVETLLAMVARPSALTRQVSKQVFETFVPYVTGEGLDALIKVLETSEDLEGQRALFENEDEMELEDEEDDKKEDDEVVDLDDMSIDGDDAVMAQISAVKASDDSVSDASSDSDSDSEVESDGEDHEAFDKKLAAVLGTHRADLDADASSGSDSDMTDSEMLALDDALAAAFKSRRNEMHPSRKSAAAAKDATLNFKNRVVDLLDILLRVQPATGVALRCLPALVTLVGRTGSKPLAGRGVEVLLNHAKALRKELPSLLADDAVNDGDEEAEEDDEEDEHALTFAAALRHLQQTHKAITAQRNSSAQFAKAASTASLSIVSAIFALRRDAIETVVIEYGIMQSSWMLGDFKIHASFFTTWMNWCQSRAQAAAEKSKN